ncbi:unnamed protein product [Penicillium salamii]|uniref:Uncharacterized protein n=1 Tax=Penicillium salamii TaxID=1612424 RepID=A0A9W4NXG2_9EURO|nr:unnamed protein product [Penicillium salamii]CAG8287553.1 unnamed protein product [Penicillium salamii]CAG8306787.1 unnamed protein product [Penicillium salamii]CAG8308135.1 unnamed protein product [Penicillium salamii]CAG8313385.1 unnamed protein product [Penicillium salamii]
MDKNKNEHSRGDPPVTSQHHTEDKALSLQDKNRPQGLVLLDEEQRSRQGASSIGSGHGFFRMQIDENSRVFNGDARGKRPDGTQLHMISGGSVKNKSTLINGDLDPEIFREIFGKDR